MRKTIIVAFALLLSGLLILEGAVAQDVEELVIAFVPSRDVHTIQLSARKIAEYLAQETGYPMRAVAMSNYAAVVVGMQSKRVDIAFVGPLNYLVLNKKTGAYPVTAAIRNAQKGYRGLIITRADANIDTLDEVKGKKMAFGDPLSASANLFPKAALLDVGLDPAKDLRSLIIQSQSAVVMAVLGGKVDAGAIYEDARQNPEVLKRFPNVLGKTKIIYRTEWIPSDPQVVRKGLAPEKVEHIRNALLQMSQDLEAKRWLKEIYNIDALVAANDADYQSLRQVVQRVKPQLLAN